MSEENIFNSETTESVGEKSSTGFQIPTEVSEFVGTGKKYSSVEDALKSVPHAQGHIKKLEEEMAQLREELSKRKAVEEVISEFRNSSTKENDSETPQSNLSQEQLMEMVSYVVNTNETKKTAKQNTDKVVAKFTEKFGEKAESEYVRIAQENGLDVNTMNALAARSPDALLKLAGIVSSPSASTAGHVSSSVNTEALPNVNSGQNLSARVKQGATTKDLVNAWHVAGEKIKTS